MRAHPPVSLLLWWGAAEALNCRVDLLEGRWVFGGVCHGRDLSYLQLNQR